MREPGFRALPSVDRLLRAPALQEQLRAFDRQAVTALVRAVLEEARSEISSGKPPPEEGVLAETAAARIDAQWRPSPRPVINATGVILHTNLGRAPLSDDAVRAVATAAAYSDLELSLQSGERDSRQSHVRSLLLALTGAEDAFVAGNAAAAVTLGLAAVARGKEVVVSRGQAVEIGGGFRVPSVLRQSGARLVEVGTVNRTRLADYRDALSPKTAALLHVHTSNFRVIGFTESVTIPELAALAHEHGLPLVVDNGSGAVLDTARYGLAHEPTPVEALAAGADVVVFSGDKLLGGPQAGIILGRAATLRRISAHPLARAMRPDKLAIAALNATLLAYLRGEAEATIPIWRMISAPLEQLEQRAQLWQARAASLGMATELVPGLSTIGGGSLPGETLPTCLLALPRSIRSAALRDARTPVIGTTRNGRVHLDPRTVLPGQDEALQIALAHVSPARDPADTVLDSAT